MLKELKYNGLTAQPNPYVSPDGDLDFSLNVVHENNSLVPVLPPGEVAVFEGAQRVFIHQNNFIHYIIVKSASGAPAFAYAAYDDGGMSSLSDPFLTLGSSETVSDITAIGNMLIVASSDKMYYLLWRNGAYNLLGNELPELSLSFALQGEIVSHNYTDCVSTQSSSITTAGESWTSLAQVAYPSVASSPASVDSILGYSLTLTANTQYRFTTVYKTIATPITAVNSSTGERETILSLASGRHATFTPSVNYSDLQIGRGPDSGNLLLIEQGNAYSAALTYAIQNTADNFNALMACAANFQADYATSQNRFIYPFFVRYAMRLYDGSYARMSEPVLIVPNTGYVPFFNYPNRAETGTYVAAYAFVADLQMRMLSSIPTLWQDIIQSVDIFISQPIYPYNQGQEYDAAKTDLFSYKLLNYDSSGNPTVNELQGLNYGNLRFITPAGADLDSKYQHRDMMPLLEQYFSFGNSATTQWPVVQVAPRSSQQVLDLIANTSSFYLAHSFRLDQLGDFSSSFADIPFKEGSLQNLTSHQALSDETMASRSLATANLYAYNNRLHAFNASFRLPKPSYLMQLNQYTEPYEAYTDDSAAYVYIHSDQGDKVVAVDGWSMLSNMRLMYGLSWFFYPDNNAYRVVFRRGDGYTVSLPLQQHPLLNGAYWLATSLHQRLSMFSVSDFSAPAVDDTTSSPSSIYVSEAGNPFTFLAASTVSVGATQVRALSTAAKPMSTGQFGQFPLYAFTDNGVWALETASSGTYTARQPATLDVCDNVGSICQLDSSVLFATERGIMEISGSTAVCISDAICSDYAAFSPSEIETAVRALVGEFNAIPYNDQPLSYPASVTMTPFRTFLQQCRIAYDYIHQRVYVYNPSMPYAYVFSIQSKSWGMVQANFMLTINSYPGGQVLSNDGAILDFGHPDLTSVLVLVITRPFALGEPDIHKTIRTVIQRGYFAASLSQVLVASNDLFSWFAVASSTTKAIRNISGSPYKFFRSAFVAELEEYEAIYGLTADFQNKLDNQPR